MSAFFVLIIRVRQRAHYIKLILPLDDKPINMPTTEEIENMANSSDVFVYLKYEVLSQKLFKQLA